MEWEVQEGNCLDLLRPMEPNSIDACVTDPPYGIGFMGKEWDTFKPGSQRVSKRPQWHGGVKHNPNLKGRKRSPAASPSQIEYDRSLSGQRGFQLWTEVWSREVLRVLKPGGYLLCCAAPRCQHRVGCGLEDAGFEIRDTLCWLFGQGFPKSLDVSKAIDRRRVEDEKPVREVCRYLRAAMEAAGLKSRDLAPTFQCDPRLIDHWAARDTDSQPSLPTIEQWAMLRTLDRLKLDGQMDAEVWRLNGRKGQPGETWFQREVIGRGEGAAATGLIYGGGYRQGFDLTAPASDEAKEWEGWGTALKPSWEPIIVARKPIDGTVAENVLEHGIGGLNIEGCRIEAAGRPARSTEASASGLTGHGGAATYGKYPVRGSIAVGVTDVGRWPANVVLDEDAARLLDTQVGDLGCVSRFFYVAKADRTERDFGCRHLPLRTPGESTERKEGSAGISPRAGAGRSGGGRNFHPTVKPIDLMRWCVRLVTPPGGRVLDPFAGSGTTGMACRYEGFGFLGMEREPEYVTIAKARIHHVAPLFS